jgi:tetratricopeptide (TPR) repeat protein
VDQALLASSSVAVETFIPPTPTNEPAEVATIRPTATDEPIDPALPKESATTSEHSVDAYFDEALSLIAAGKLKEARTYFTKAMALEPNNTRVQGRLALLEERIEKEIESRFIRARQAFTFLRYDEAIADWEVVMELADPSDPRYVESQRGIGQANAKRR